MVRQGGVAPADDHRPLAPAGRAAQTARRDVARHLSLVNARGAGAADNRCGNQAMETRA
jgi:hypothetical protein